MKRKMALLMAMVFCLMCCFSSFAFAEDDAVIAEEIVVEETTEEIAEEPAEESVDEPAEAPAEEIPAEDAAEESAEEAADEEIIEEAPAEATPDSEEDKMTLKTCELNIPTEGYVEYTPKVYPNPYLENLKHLDFKKLSIYLTEQDENVDLIFSSDNKANKLRRKTNFRFTIKEPLKKYIIPTPYSLPDMLADEKENF